MKPTIFFVFIFIASIFCTNATIAQSSRNLAFGEIVGQLNDCYGDGISNAKITVQGGKIKRKLKSKNTGEFKFALLEGIYQITIEKYGFKRYIVQNVEVKPNSARKINVIMESGYASDDPNSGEQNFKPCPSVQAKVFQKFQTP